MTGVAHFPTITLRNEMRMRAAVPPELLVNFLFFAVVANQAGPFGPAFFWVSKPTVD
jgi:hypothetical protein